MGGVVKALTGSVKSPKAVKDERQEQAMEQQRKDEQRRLAEEESELERRKAVASQRVGGRGSLIKTSPTGTMSGISKKLGG